MFNVYYLEFIDSGRWELRPNIDWRLRILFSGIKYGNILTYVDDLSFVIESKYLFKFEDTDSERIYKRNTLVNDTFEIEDRGFAMAGDDVIFLVENSHSNLYDWKKDLNNYEEFPTNNSLLGDSFSIIYGKSTRSHSKKYQPFGIDRLGNPGDGIVAIKIFKQ